MQTVLIVDSDEDNRQILSEILEQAGYFVVLAASAGEGGFLLPRISPSVILLNILVMGNGNFLKIRNSNVQTAAIPVVMIASENKVDIGGISEVIDKPFSSQKVLTAIKKHALK